MTQEQINPLWDESGNDSRLYTAGSPTHDVGGFYNFSSGNTLTRNSFNQNGNITLSAWVKAFSAGSAGSTARAVASQPSGGSPNGGFAITWSTGNILACSMSNNTSTTVTLTSLTTQTINSWLHITCVFERNATHTTQYMYINGTHHRTGTPTSFSGGILNNNLTIGGQPISSFGFWNGSIDDVRIWNKSLTSSEISSVYANGSITSGLLAYYPFTNQSQVGGCQ